MSELKFYKRKKKINGKILGEIFKWILEILIVVSIAYVFVHFVAEKTTIIGQSMAPTMIEGDHVVINKIIYKISSPKRNDVVVFSLDENQEIHYIKRIIGLPGEIVQILDGKIYINGEILEDKLETEEIKTGGLADEPVVLGTDEYFLLGDNRNNSEDSRFANVGNVKGEDVLGKTWFRISPYDKIGFIN